MAIIDVVPILRVADADAAVDFYCSTLGFVEEFRYSAGPDGPTYVGLSIDEKPVHLSTFPGDGAERTAVYFYVDNVDALLRNFVERGLETPGNADSPVEQEPIDQAWGMREFYVRDPDGNALRFGSALSRDA